MQKSQMETTHLWSIQNHFLAKAKKCLSPNADARPELAEIKLIVLHCISLPPGEFGANYVEKLFMNKLNPRSHPSFATTEGLQVSAHLYINREGAVTQFVAFNRRAWHAGISVWQEHENCNDFSIGIELEGSEIIPYSRLQYETLTRAVISLFATYKELGIEHITGHSDIAPERKTDPGPSFDWHRMQTMLLASPYYR